MFRRFSSRHGCRSHRSIQRIQRTRHAEAVGPDRHMQVDLRRGAEERGGRSEMASLKGCPQGAMCGSTEAANVLAPRQLLKSAAARRPSGRRAGRRSVRAGTARSQDPRPSNLIRNALKRWITLLAPVRARHARIAARKESRPTRSDSPPNPGQIVFGSSPLPHPGRGPNRGAFFPKTLATPRGIPQNSGSGAPGSLTARCRG